MPTPGENESREEFMGHCPSDVIADGTTDDRAQAVAICNSMWEERDKGDRMKRERKTFDAKVIKADEKTGIVDTIFAVMGNVDHGGDMIHPGAFAKTFAERGNQVLVLDQHNTDSISRALGHPRAFREIEKAELPPELLERHPEATGGAFASVQFNMKTPEGAGAFHRLDAGDISQWSFAYDALDVDFSDVVKDGESVTVRNLRTLRLYEISPVLFPMNDATMTVAAKADVMKTEEDGDHPASHYLVVEDPQKVSTWHLRVYDVEGKPDHRLMGAAWAALHGGYRGNVYEGPGKSEAIAKLKRLYASEDMETPKAITLEDAYAEYAASLKMTVEELSDADKRKAGRVLSARNATRINAAIGSLIEALDSAGIELDGFTRTPADDDADDGKSNDAPATEQAAKDDQGAGPDTPPTLEVERQQLLLKMARQI